jgi:mRNA-degrading endonuclease RelE of RelBE toxin-antitoxin system
MKYRIVLAPEAVEDFKALDVHTRAEVRDSIELHLRHEPTRSSRSRIKRLRGLSRPQYRLRVGEVRIYYDVSRSTVEILGIIEKSKSQEWLGKAGGSL